MGPAVHWSNSSHHRFDVRLLGIGMKFEFFSFSFLFQSLDANWHQQPKALEPKAIEI